MDATNTVDKQEVLEYLDELRESCIANMSGAALYIREEFDIGRGEARELFREWRETFAERHKEDA